MTQRRALLLGAAAALCAPARAVGPWPSRPVRLLVAYAPGGVSDDITRVLAERLSQRIGVPVLVENRAGAGGSLAMAVLARAPADGHTLCFSAVTPLTLLPLLGPVRYDPERDIAPVASVMSTPVLVVATQALDARDLPQALARAGTGGLRWATSGLGTTGYLVMEQVRRSSGVAITHVPYKGGSQQISDALGGQFELLSTNVGSVQLGHVRQGRLQALAVGAPARLPVLPMVPTLAEAGFASANLWSLFGLFAPGETPTALRAQLNAEVNAVLSEPDLQARLKDVNNIPVLDSPRGFAQRIAQEAAVHRSLAETR